MLGAIADNSISLLVCLLIVEGFYSSAQLGGAKSVSLWFPQSQRGFAMEIRQAGLPLGGALAGIVLPTSAFVYGIQGAFLVGAIVSFLGGCIFIIFYHSPEKIVAIVSESKEKVSFYANVKSRLAMLTAPHMKNIIFSGVSLVIVQYVLTIFITIYFYRIYHLSLAKSAYLFFVSQASGALGRIILAAWSDHCRKGRFFPVLFCMIAVVFGFLILILGISGSIIYLTILSAWLVFWNGMVWPLGRLYCRLFTERKRWLFSGFSNVCKSNRNYYCSTIIWINPRFYRHLFTNMADFNYCFFTFLNKKVGKDNWGGNYNDQ